MDIMESFVAVGVAAVGLICVLMMLRPITRVEKALLIERASSSGVARALELADEAAARQWLTQWEFDRTRELIARVIANDHADIELATSAERMAARAAMR